MVTDDNCGKNSHDSVVSALISAGASVDQATEDGFTPLCGGTGGPMIAW